MPIQEHPLQQEIIENLSKKDNTPEEISKMFEGLPTAEIKQLRKLVMKIIHPDINSDSIVAANASLLNAACDIAISENSKTTNNPFQGYDPQARQRKNPNMRHSESPVDTEYGDSITQASAKHKEALQNATETYCEKSDQAKLAYRDGIDRNAAHREFEACTNAINKEFQKSKKAADSEKDTATTAAYSKRQESRKKVL